MPIDKFSEFDGHEIVSSMIDVDAGLRGFIAIHNTNLGPATGGTRYALYHSEDDALRDALRLSRAMTYKCALAGIPYGGGKAVIIGDPRKPKSKALLAAYARRINLFRGNFYTGEDAGMRKEDISFLIKKSPFVNGRKGQAGSLAPWTALGAFAALESALQAVFGTTSMEEKKIAIKGLGKIGGEICRLAYERGAKVWVADVNKEAVAAIKKKFPKVGVVGAEQIHRLKVDIYSPNAMGNEFTLASAKEVRARIICGGANNQLANISVGQLFHKRGILYLPDYLVNAGGLISIMAEVDLGGFDRVKVTKRIQNIGRTARQVIEISSAKNLSTVMVADRVAEAIFKPKNKKR